MRSCVSSTERVKEAMRATAMGPLGVPINIGNSLDNTCDFDKMLDEFATAGFNPRRAPIAKGTLSRLA